MVGRLDFLWPEIALFITTCVVMVLGLSRSLSSRKATSFVAVVGCAVAGVLAWKTTPSAAAVVESGGKAGQLLLPEMVAYAKGLIAIVGCIMILALAGTVDRSEEAQIAAGQRSYDPLRANRAEFYSFVLFSLTGLMLCASADDLIWLFLALELTSLPTYIMVTISTAKSRGREAGVKYFFLGAMGAAVFLYGFALIYGGSGSTNLNAIATHIRTHGLDALTLGGMLLALLGLGFKIAAVPMHFYTADVYQGAAPQVSGFLAFVPKTAGFIAIILLCAAMGWNYAKADGLNILSGTVLGGNGTHLPEWARLLLWVMAALTMTVGNVLAVLQTNVKRILAYSSVAHSGYILVAIVAGPGDGSFPTNGLAAALFYLLSYGVMNVGTFAVLSALERSPGKDGEFREVEEIGDLRGLWRSHPALAVVMGICAMSLLGLPPLLGFLGKMPLFTSAISAGEIPLVIILGINSAIAAYYYIRLAAVPFLENADPNAEPMLESPFRSRVVAGLLSAGGVIVLAIVGGRLMDTTADAARFDGGDRAIKAMNSATPVRSLTQTP
jgi:NADH-quinone oxidoreductase subunit N